MTERSRSTTRATVSALLAIILIVGALLWIGQAIVARNRMQNCIDSGRRDCLPVPAGE